MRWKGIFSVGLPLNEVLVWKGGGGKLSFRAKNLWLAPELFG